MLCHDCGKSLGSVLSGRTKWKHLIGVPFKVALCAECKKRRDNFESQELPSIPMLGPTVSGLVYGCCPDCNLPVVFNRKSGKGTCRGCGQQFGGHVVVKVPEQADPDTWNAARRARPDPREKATCPLCGRLISPTALDVPCRLFLPCAERDCYRRGKIECAEQPLPANHLLCHTHRCVDCDYCFTPTKSNEVNLKVGDVLKHKDSRACSSCRWRVGEEGIYYSCPGAIAETLLLQTNLYGTIAKLIGCLKDGTHVKVDWMD